jgi:hypothetical protein
MEDTTFQLKLFFVGAKLIFSPDAIVYLKLFMMLSMLNV